MVTVRKDTRTQDFSFYMPQDSNFSIRHLHGDRYLRLLVSETCYWSKLKSYRQEGVIGKKKSCLAGPALWVLDSISNESHV